MGGRSGDFFKAWKFCASPLEHYSACCLHVLWPPGASNWLRYGGRSVGHCGLFGWNRAIWLVRSVSLKLLPQQYVIRIRIRTLTTYLRIRSPYKCKGRTNRDYAILSRLTTTSAKESVSDGPALLLVICWKDVWEHLTVFVLDSCEALNMTLWDFIDFDPCFGASRWPGAPEPAIFCQANFISGIFWS